MKTRESYQYEPGDPVRVNHNTRGWVDATVDKVDRVYVPEDWGNIPHTAVEVTLFDGKPYTADSTSVRPRGR